MSNFQDELRNDDGYENIVFIAVGQSNISSFNNNFCANSNLPLVMDQHPNFPIRTEFAPYGQHKQVVILDYNGNYIGSIYATSVNDSFKDYIREVLEEHYQQFILGDINGDSFINVQDVILLVNSILSNQTNPLGDINNDGLVNILDVIQVTNIILSP